MTLLSRIAVTIPYGRTIAVRPTSQHFDASFVKACAVIFLILLVTMPAFAQGKATVLFDLKPLLGQDFAAYEAVFGKPIDIKHTTQPDVILMGGKETEIGVTKSEIRFYKVNGLRRAIVRRDDSHISDDYYNQGVSQGLNSKGEKMQDKTRYVIRLELSKPNKVKTWQQGIGIFGFDASGVAVNFFKDDDEGVSGYAFTYKLYEQCPLKLGGGGSWQPTTQTALFSVFVK